jgi:uncharacterized protein Smg (DUF494 family)
MALIVYTQEEIDKIHSKKQAVHNQLYGGPGDTVYIGRLDGYLEKAIDLQGEVGGSTLATLVNSIGNFSREEIVTLLGSIENLATKEELASEVKKLKCFNLAMSVAL